MKVIAIQGSPRVDGNTTKLLGAMFDGHQVEIVHVVEAGIRPYDYAGFPDDDPVRSEMQGRSLLPVVGGAPGKRAILSRTVWERPVYALRDERHKLIHNLPTDEVELFDLVADPHELRNLAGRPEYASVEKRLAEELRAWRARVEKP